MDMLVGIDVDDLSKAIAGSDERLGCGPADGLARSAWRGLAPRTYETRRFKAISTDK
jgi:hypothetical protein